nr:hypothetical protein [Tanacetum cinerariifolium]
LWRTVAVKSSNDVTRLQALVDKKRVMVTEAAIRDALHLDDDEGVDCLPNEENFTELARIGRKFNFSKYIFESLVRNVDNSTKFYMYPRKVGKGCLRVETPLFEGMLVAREPEEQGDVEEQGNEEEQGNDDTTAEEPETTVLEDTANDQPIPLPTLLTPPPQQPQDEALDACSALARRVEHIEQDKVAQDLEIIKLKTRGRVIDKDEDAVKETKEVREYTADTQVEGRQADIYHIDMDHTEKVLSMQEDESEVQEAVEVITTAKLITEVVAAVSETVSADVVIPSAVPETISAATAIPTVTAPPVKVVTPVKAVVPSTRRKRGVVIWDPEEESSAKTPTETTYKEKGKAKFNVNMEFLLKSKEQIKEEESRAIAFINETPAQKAAKRRKLIEEAKEAESIKQHLQLVPNEDDDVFTEATPLARKVPVIILLVERRYPLTKFTMEQMLNVVRLQVKEETLKMMFERPYGQDNLWRNQSTIHGQALVKSWKLLTSCGVHIISLNTTQIILLVERRYPLMKFTLEQMLNVVRLQVEEDSEMSLELIRFTRQQLQEAQHN